MLERWGEEWGEEWGKERWEKWWEKWWKERWEERWEVWREERGEVWVCHDIVDDFTEWYNTVSSIYLRNNLIEVCSAD